PAPAASLAQPGDSRPAPEPIVHSTRRGGAVVVDWPADSDSLDAGAMQARGRVRFDAPSGSLAGLSIDEVRRGIEAGAGLVRACYEAELPHAPELHGALLVHIRIGGDGRVQAVDAAPAGAALHSDAVAQCVSDAVERLRFPAKGGIADVNYVFEFTQSP